MGVFRTKLRKTLQMFDRVLNKPLVISFAEEFIKPFQANVLFLYALKF